MPFISAPLADKATGWMPDNAENSSERTFCISAVKFLKRLEIKCPECAYVLGL